MQPLGDALICLACIDQRTDLARSASRTSRRGGRSGGGGGGGGGGGSGAASAHPRRPMGYASQPRTLKTFAELDIKNRGWKVVGGSGLANYYYLSPGVETKAAGKQPLATAHSALATQPPPLCCGLGHSRASDPRCQGALPLPVRLTCASNTNPDLRA